MIGIKTTMAMAPTMTDNRIVSWLSFSVPVP